MARQLNWIVSQAVASGVSRQLRNRLAMSTILAVVPFLGYGRQAYAACTEIGATAVYECSDTSATETVTDNNADVSTLASPPFVVTTGGVSINGLGDIRFTDTNASSITSNTNGLQVISNGDDGGTDGAVTITTNGNIFATANGIIALNYGSGDIEVTSDGRVFGANGDGIYANNSSDGGDLTITTGAQSYSYGNANGISARNNGDGDLEITANGDHYGGGYGVGFDGIYGYNSANGGDLTITAGATSTAKGNSTGIGAVNYGDGDLEVTADGTVRGYNAAGIFAFNSANGGDLTVTTGAKSSITGRVNGIDAENDGDSDLEITANGQVAGENGHGIFAQNGFGGDSNNLTITTGAQSAVTGDENGIYAKNFGDGDLEITANGHVTGQSEDGIYAYNAGQGTYYTGEGHDLTVTTGAQSVVVGFDDGIDANNHGDGDLSVTANGQVTGEDGDGIEAFNDEYGHDLTVTTGAGSLVHGQYDGIDAENDGDGNLEITVNGQVFTEEDNGIEADNNGANLTITTGVGSSISAGHDGINVSQYGDGNFEITANGNVEGRGDDGIYGANYGQNFTVTTGAGTVVTGVDDGIDARHYGEGNFDITANGLVTGTDSNGIEALNDGDAGDDTVIEVGASGLVQGNYSGIFVISNSSQDIEITNNGLVRNLSAESNAQAIHTLGGASDIENHGDLIGTVWLNAPFDSDDTLDNTGFWNPSNGLSDFGGGDDEVINTGTLRAADDPITAEFTILENLESFDNDGGLITMVDGQEGDVLRIGGGPIEYTGTNGRLAVDAVLADPSSGLADLLVIGGNTDGKTLVHVNVVGVGGANPGGIPVIAVEGSTSEEDFDLDGPLNAGFFTWDLRLDGTIHLLYTSGIGVGAFEFAAGITGAQEVWHQTTGTLLQRQADLRSLLGGTAVTPVADYSEPVAPTPVAHVTPGFWMRGVGAYIERDHEEDGFILDRKQTIWGGMAGFDFGIEDVSSAWLFGIFGGYLTSDLDFDETNSEWTYEGPTMGAYATYLDDAFYADLTVKVDILDIDIDPDDLGPGENGDTDALNIGGRIDTGYKFGHSIFVEPQATLAVVHTEIDDVDIFGGTVEFDDETSIRGRLGLRLGFDHTNQSQVVYSGDVTASVWEEFSGDNNVTITDPVMGSFGASDDPGETLGDVSVGFSAAAPEGWSGFLRANYLFGDDYEAVTGNAGVRFAW